MILGNEKPKDVYGFDKLDQIVDKHFNTSLVSIDIHVQWLKFRVKQDKKWYILRVWEHPDDYRLGKYNLRREIRFLKYCEQIGYPHVLQLHSYDFERDILEYDYYIYEFIEGKDFYQITQECNPDEKKQLYHNLGIVIGKLHKHRFDRQVEFVLEQDGEIQIVEAEPWQYDPEHDWIYKHFSHIYEYAEKYDELKPYVKPIEELFEKYAGFRTQEPRTIGLVHYDLAADNMIVLNKGQSIDDFYMIDFTFAGPGWISLDLGRIERRFTTWRNTLPLDEVEKYLSIMIGAYRSVIEIPREYVEEEGVIFQLIQLIDDFWMFEKEDHWLSQDTERGMKVRLWELDRMIEQYL